MKLKFLTGEPGPIYSHRAYYMEIVNSIWVTYMRTPGWLGLTLIRTDISQNKWILRTRQRGRTNPVDQFSANETVPRLTSPHLKRSRRGSIRPSTRTNDDSRGNSSRIRVLSRRQDARGARSRVARTRGLRPSYLSLARERRRRSVSKIANDEIPSYRRTANGYFRTESIFRARHLFGRHRASRANFSSRHINTILYCASSDVFS